MMRRICLIVLMVSMLAGCLYNPPFILNLVWHQHQSPPQTAAPDTTPWETSWARQFGGAGDDYGSCVAVDGSGNVYVGGGVGDKWVGPQQPNREALLAKYDASGRLVWQKFVKMDARAHFSAIAIDVSGGIRACGWTDDGYGGPDMCMARYDSSGELLWKRCLGLNNHHESATAIAVDKKGNAYICGWTTGTFEGSHEGSDNAFLGKFDAAGNTVWIRYVITQDREWGTSVALDKAGNVYMSGWTMGGAVGGPYKGGRCDAFMVKYDSAGNVLWEQQVGTEERDEAHAIALDRSNNIYLAGFTEGVMDKANAGRKDAFLAKYDSSGKLLWTRQWGFYSHDNATSLAIDDHDNVYMNGTAWRTPGNKTGALDIFLVKYSGSGEKLWEQILDSGSNDYSTIVAVYGSDTAYVTGYTLGGFDGPCAGGNDGFLAKFSRQAK